MRPLELRLRNFRSFAGDEHTIDFRGRRLMGIVGPIGSGKSSILDAITFSLYGRTPRSGKSTKALIHQQKKHASVRLRFVAGGQVWETVRTVRRKGASQHALYRLPGDVAPERCVPEEKIILEREVNNRIFRIIRLDYQAFSRSVMLAQGQFADFLTATPSERDKVLKGVFGYNRIDDMREAARKNIIQAKHETEKLGIRISNAETVEQKIVEQEKLLTGTVNRQEQLLTIRPEFDRLTERIESASSESNKTADQLRNIRDHTAMMPRREEIEQVLTLASDTKVRIADAEYKLAEATSLMTATDNKVRSGILQQREQVVQQASELIARLATLEEATETIRTAVSRAHTEYTKNDVAEQQALVQMTEAHVTLKTATVDDSTARQSLHTATERLQETYQDDMTSILRGQLTPGGCCPVCEQTVNRVPAADQADSGAVIAQQVYDYACAQQEQTEHILHEAERGMSVTKSEYDTAVVRVAESAQRIDEALYEEEQHQQRVDNTRQQIQNMLGDGPPDDLLAEEKNRLQKVRNEAESARQEREKALAERDRIVAETKHTSAQQLSSLRSRMTAIANFIQPGLDLSDSNPSTLREAWNDLRNTRHSLIVQLEQSAAELNQRRKDAVSSLSALKQQYDIPVSVGETLAAVSARRTHLEEDIRQGREQLKGLDEWKKEHHRWSHEGTLYQRLASDLTNSKFVRYLMDAKREELAGLGSEHFETLTSGRYRFTEDGKFRVVDLHAGGRERGSDSLSGGEAFLASLGLALGLAEMVGREGGGSLDAFFLDEGFGALDPEHLDLAMSGIEALAANRTERLVVVVSHVPEVKNRVEDLVVLHKDHTSGMSTVQTGGLGTVSGCEYEG